MPRAFFINGKNGFYGVYGKRKVETKNGAAESRTEGESKVIEEAEANRRNLYSTCDLKLKF